MSDFEDQIRQAVTGNVRPALPRTDGPRGGIVTGGQLHESLLQLLARAGAVEEATEHLVGVLVGPNGRRGDPAGPVNAIDDEPLFPRLARRIVEVNRTLERIEAELKRGTELLR